jgi:hypothetical protein
MEFKQRVIVKFLTNESLDANEIHAMLDARCGEQAYTLSTMQFWVGEI